ncbi:hypothetical protein CR513_50959, partial [Mucuna pruriens]
MENQLAKLTSLVRQLVVGQQQPAMAAKICGICTSVEHPTDMCSTLKKSTIWKATISAKAESRAICSSAIRTCLECTSRSSRLPIVKFKLRSTTIPVATIVTPQGNSLSLEDLMKQLAANNLEIQQSMSSNNMQFQQNMTATIQDLKMQIRQLADTLRRSAEVDSEPDADSPSRFDKVVLVPFPTWTISARKPKSDEELLKIDLGIFSVPCTIGKCTFADAMLDLGASINVRPTSIYRALNFGDLEPTRMTIQLANRSIVQPLASWKMFSSKSMN